jgi:hypothetical protein
MVGGLGLGLGLGGGGVGVLHQVASALLLPSAVMSDLIRCTWPAYQVCWQGRYRDNSHAAKPQVMNGITVMAACRWRQRHQREIRHVAACLLPPPLPPLIPPPLVHWGRAGQRELVAPMSMPSHCPTQSSCRSVLPWCDRRLLHGTASAPAGAGCGDDIVMMPSLLLRQWLVVPGSIDSAWQDDDDDQMVVT